MPSVAINAAIAIGGTIIRGVYNASREREQRARDRARARQAAQDQRRKDKERANDTRDRIYSTIKPTKPGEIINNSNNAQRLVYGEVFSNGIINFDRIAQNIAWRVQQFLLASTPIEGVLEIHMDDNVIGLGDVSSNGVVMLPPYFVPAGEAISNSELPDADKNITGLQTDPRYYTLVSAKNSPLPHIQQLDARHTVDPIINHFFPGNDYFLSLGHGKVTLAFYRGALAQQSLLDSEELADVNKAAEINRRLQEEARRAFPNDEPPQPLFRFRGANDLLDPRTGERKWTRNAALVIANGSCHRLMGLGLTMEDNWDLDSLAEAADYCDELIEDQNGDLFQRHTIDDIYQTAEDPVDVLNSWAESTGGSKIKTRNDKYILDINRPKNFFPGISDEDLIDDLDINNHQHSQEEFKGARIEFIDNDLKGQLTEAPTLVHPDINSNNIASFNFRGLVNNARAQYNAIPMIKTQLYTNSITATVGLKFLPYEVGDVIPVDLSDFPFINGLYEIVAKIDDEIYNSVTLELKEFSNEKFVLDNKLGLLPYDRSGVQLLPRRGIADSAVREILDLLGG